MADSHDAEVINQQRELLKAEHSRAMQLVAEERAVAQRSMQASQAKMLQAEQATASLAQKELEVKRLVEAAEQQVGFKTFICNNY